MIKLNGSVTDACNFYEGTDPYSLSRKFGTPLYVYNESILRQRCRELTNLVTYKNFRVNYSPKANSNLALLQIIKEEGLMTDAMSPGEIYAVEHAGFKNHEIMYICNNVSAEEMKYAIERDILISVDSVSQLEQYGRINAGGRVAVRFNGGIGAGHHAKVMTAGKNTKFGVNAEYVPDVKNLLSKYSLKLVGINQHIGSLFMEPEVYISGSAALLEIAKSFEDLDFIDLGGGFGTPYFKQNGQKRLDLKALGESLDILLKSFAQEYGKEVMFKIEPGRYISAESSVLLGTVHAVKYNGENKYIGTDIGMSVIIRPAMYDSHHDIEVYRDSEQAADGFQKEYVTVVGNICETGDIIAEKRELPEILEGDLLGVLDAGAYGHTMSSNYNNRLRPAEVLLRTDGSVCLIRERDTYEDLLRRQIKLY